MTDKVEKEIYRRMLQSRLYAYTGLYLRNENPKTTEFCEKILCDLCLIISASVKEYCEKNNIKI